MAAVVLMATPCTNPLAGGSGGHKRQRGGSGRLGTLVCMESESVIRVEPPTGRTIKKRAPKQQEHQIEGSGT